MSAARTHYTFENIAIFWDIIHKEITKFRFNNLPVEMVKEGFKKFLLTFSMTNDELKKTDTFELNRLLHNRLHFQIIILQKNKVFPEALTEFLIELANDIKAGGLRLKNIINSKPNKNSQEPLSSNAISEFTDSLKVHRTEEEIMPFAPTKIRTGHTIAEANLIPVKNIKQESDNSRVLYDQGEKYLLEKNIEAATRCFKLSVGFENGEFSATYHVTTTNNIKTLEFLADIGVKLDGKDNDGWAPIHTAASQNSAAAMRLLTNPIHKLNLDQTTLDGATAAYLATLENSDDCLTILAEKGANLEKTDDNGWAPIHTAASENSAAAMRVLTNPKYQLNLDLTTPDECTAAFIAAEHNHIEIIEILADKKADLNKPNLNKQTPISIAIEKKHIDSIRLLLTYSVLLSPIDSKSIANLNDSECNILLKQRENLSANDIKLHR